MLYNSHQKFKQLWETIFTSLSCKQKYDCEEIIEAIRNNIGQFTFRKNSTPSGKHFFRLSKDGFILATSRKYSTELRLQKGIDEIIKYVLTAEILDFSENEFVFPDEQSVFIG